MYIVAINELLSHISIEFAFAYFQEKMENLIGHEQ
jgi:hypothetical protein